MNASKIFKRQDISSDLAGFAQCIAGRKQNQKDLLPETLQPLPFDFGKIYSIPVDHICPNPAQPRRSFSPEAITRLADSIRKYGILQPLSVRSLAGQPLAGSGNIRDGIYELIAGERRLRAAKLLGITEVPCIFIDADNRRSAELALIENLQREDLNLFEQAGAIAALIDIYHMTQEQIAQQLSCSQSYVANKLRILKLTPPERKLITEFGLTERHARALLRIDNPETRIAVIKNIIAKGLNVAQSEAYIERILSPKEEVLRTDAKRKLIIKDMRIFYNTIDKAIDTISRAGISVAHEKLETPAEVELRIRIPKSCA